ncbi:DUF4097 family beta strand repeat-containing protein [Fodinibius halophilus]|uniref:DUF4097 domain-containing protein n=1 Tax=Fodinibius halophilus TaxID=1736908 RepID=A0A6M1SUP0_9BACT|nr:DUF4097 family beta strand repeat-containing protein [Fodinibius halophilus]NGP87276.1 DUF4097 domain-containing protein [Fodinibius halophilus]
MTSRKSYLTEVALILFIALMFTLALMSTSMASASLSKIQDEPYRVDTFDITSPGNLEVETSGGHITVKGRSSTKARIEMYVSKNGRNLLPEDTDIDKWDIDISQSGNSLRAVAKREGSSGWSLFGKNNNLSISFVVYSPREISTDLETSGGHIDIENLMGNQHLSTSGGHLELANLEGTIDARTSGGHINITDIEGDLEARTSGGHINVNNANGQLAVKTSGGYIDLANTNGRVDAKTSGGSITADLTSIDQFVSLRTSGGNISISVHRNLGLDLDLRGSYVSSKLENLSGEIEEDEVKGRLNGGGAQLKARTSGGTVSLSFH